MKTSSATVTVRSDLDRAGKPIAALQHVSLRVSYQRISYDFAVADGEYTPGQLRRAGKVVRPWGPVRDYTLALPAADAGLLNPRPSSAPMPGVPTAHEH